MTQATFKHVAITGIAVTVPENEISIYDEARYYDNNVKKIDRMRKKIGFYKRRVVDENTTAEDLALSAAQNLLKGTGTDPKSIDALIYVVQKEDYNGPTDAYELHHNLGLSPDCICSNINQACPGWIFGLYLASVMIEGGLHKRILLLCGDTQSVDIDIDDRYSAPLMGDAGCATLLEYSETERPSYYGLETYSENFDAIIIPASGTRLRVDYGKERTDPFNAPLFEKLRSNGDYRATLLNHYMDGDAVFTFTMNEVPKCIKKTLAYANTELADLGGCLLHQANKQIVQTIGMALGLNPADVPSGTFSKYGNNRFCSIPTVLCDLHDEGKTLSDKPYVLSAFGTGLSVATAVLKLDGIYLDGVKDYVRPEGAKTREQWAEFWQHKVISTAAKE